MTIQRMNDLMIDLETMGNGSNAPIVSLGAVFFDIRTGELGQKLYLVISLSDQMKRDAVPDAETILWWLKQSYESRRAITDGSAVSVNYAILEIEAFVRSGSKNINELNVWGNGSSFDNTILRNLYARTCNRTPWRWNADRDVRTIVQLGRDIGYDPKRDMPFAGDRHNALNDAVHQAKYVSAIYQKLMSHHEIATD